MDAHLATISSTDRVIICSIVRGEILYGLERLPQGRRRLDLETKAKNLFAVLPCEPIPATAGDHYARTKHTRQSQVLSLDENDLWITATALALDAVLVSRDSDFDRTDGLRVANWAERDLPS